jgi:5'-nucleotidase
MKDKENIYLKKPVILVDTDDTLGDFSKVYWEIHNLVFKDKVDHNIVNDWDLSKFSNRGKEAYKLFKFPGLFRNLPLKPFAQEFMGNIQKFSDVYVVSDSPPGTSYKEIFDLENIDHNIEFPHSNPADDKRMWLKEYFPNFPQSNIIFCSCKWMVYGDILVDDKPETFEIFTNLGRDIILMDMPYNRHIQTKWRAKDLKQAEEMIYDILERQGKISA